MAEVDWLPLCDDKKMPALAEIDAVGSVVRGM